VFEVTAKGKETVLHSFPDNTMDGGHANEQSLAIDGKGNLYGTTETGGTYGKGVVFKLSITSKPEIVLYNFSSSGGDGELPSGLVRDNRGHLFGAQKEWPKTHPQEGLRPVAQARRNVTQESPLEPSSSVASRAGSK